MSGKEPSVNDSIAPLKNVAILVELIQNVQKRRRGLPGLATYFGPSGYGKTVSCIFAVTSPKIRAHHVQVQSVWTRKKLCTAILDTMGIRPNGTIPELVDLIGEELSKSDRPLLIDEADHLVDKNMIEIVRDIYESSLAPVILIGEESLPQKLKRWERIHGRMLDWRAAQPASLDDARQLAKFYCAGIAIGDDLLGALHEASGGSIRRVCVNLDRLREASETMNKNRLALGDYQRPFFTGNPPSRRAA